MGRTMVLYRAVQHREMSLLRNFAVEKAVIKLQSYNRGWHARLLADRHWAVREELRGAIAARGVNMRNRAVIASHCFASELEQLKEAIGYADDEADWTIHPEYPEATALRDLVAEELRLTGVLEVRVCWIRSCWYSYGE